MEAIEQESDNKGGNGSSGVGGGRKCADCPFAVSHSGIPGWDSSIERKCFWRMSEEVNREWRPISIPLRVEWRKPRQVDCEITSIPDGCAPPSARPQPVPSDPNLFFLLLLLLLLHFLLLLLLIIAVVIQEWFDPIWDWMERREESSSSSSPLPSPRARPIFRHCGWDSATSIHLTLIAIQAEPFPEWWISRLEYLNARNDGRWNKFDWIISPEPRRRKKWKLNFHCL